jgi:hypothetical protein
MSWWNLPGKQHDVIGDRPADIVGTALRRAATHREPPHNGPLPLPQILGALGRAIAENRDALEDPPLEGARVVAVTNKGEIEPSQEGEDILEPLGAAIRGVEAAYRERFERSPRLAELLGVFTFDLRPDHDGLLDLEIRGT